MIVAGSSNLRISNEFANVNTIGLACALSCVIQINFKCLSSKKHFSPSALLMIPSVVVIAATQSRKALVFLIVGVLGYAFIKAQKSPKSIFIKGFKIKLCILLDIAAGYF